MMEFRGVIIELVKLFKPNVYMELGTWKGYTFNAVAPLVKTAIAVDKGPMDDIKDRPNVKKYNMFTDDLAKTWKDPIDFLFIDCCHERDQVLMDFYNFSRFVKFGTGLIFMHDTHPINKNYITPGHCHDAWEAANYITKYLYHDFEIVTFPGPIAGFSILRKRTDHLSWNIGDFHMHKSSMVRMKKFLNDNLDKDKKYKILDVGSLCVSGPTITNSYKAFIQSPKWEYKGIDIIKGKNVDIVASNPFKYPIDSNSYDIVISGQTIEHTKDLDKWFKELYRVLKPGGKICIIGPSSGKIHHQPDYWRVLPDGMRALLERAGFTNIKIEIGTNEPWKDCVGIATKPKQE